jgi:hypothetical protein
MTCSAVSEVEILELWARSLQGFGGEKQCSGC